MSIGVVLVRVGCCARSVCKCASVVYGLYDKVFNFGLIADRDSKLKLLIFCFRSDGVHIDVNLDVLTDVFLKLTVSDVGCLVAQGKEKHDKQSYEQQDGNYRVDSPFTSLLIQIFLLTRPKRTLNEFCSFVSTAKPQVCSVTAANHTIVQLTLYHITNYTVKQNALSINGNVAMQRKRSGCSL